jgi:hypothetical protein
MLGALLIFLSVLLAVLKLAGVLAISWWLVFAPALVFLASIAVFFGLWLSAFIAMAWFGRGALTIRRK